MIYLGRNPKDQGGKRRPPRSERSPFKGLVHRWQWRLRNLGVGRQTCKPNGEDRSHEECSRFHQKERYATNWFQTSPYILRTSIFLFPLQDQFHYHFMSIFCNEYLKSFCYTIYCYDLNWSNTPKKLKIASWLKKLRLFRPFYMYIADIYFKTIFKNLLINLLITDIFTLMLLIIHTYDYKVIMIKITILSIFPQFFHFLLIIISL